MSVVTDYMATFGIKPDHVVDLREVEFDNPEIVTKHRHVVVILDDDSELWLDIDASDGGDHNFTDIRWMNPDGEMKGTGVFTIVNGQRGTFKHKLYDTEGRLVEGHGWAGGYVTTLLVDKNGVEKTAIVPSDGNG